MKGTANTRQNRASRTSRVRGAALIEGALVVPFLLFLFLGVFDLGRALNQYFLLSRLAYEAARAGSEQEGLECPSIEGEPTAPVCYETPAPMNIEDSACGVSSQQPRAGHSLLHTRIDALLRSQAIRLTGPVSFSSTCKRVDGEGTNALAVEVKLRLTYQAMFMVIMPNLTIGSTVTAPYLLTRRD